MENIWLQIISQVGATGLLAYVMYSLAKSERAQVTAQVIETIKQMTLRIDAAEKRADATDKRLEGCEQDRVKLHQTLADVYLKITHPPSPQ
jgi:hypothetical protein